MPRSLTVAPEFIEQLKSSVQRNGFPSQKALALDLGISRATVNNFLNGKPVDYLYFVEICEKLRLNWQQIIGTYESTNTEVNYAKSPDKVAEQATKTYFTFPDYSTDFYERQECQELEEIVQNHPVVSIYGEPGVGKTYLAAELARRLSKNYQVCWLDQEGLTLDELLGQINNFLEAIDEQGFVTTHAKEKEAGITISIKRKVATLVEVIKSSKKGKYVFFIDNFQKVNPQEINLIKLFIERFRSHAGENKLVLIDHFPDKTLGTRFATNVIKKILIAGFQEEDALNYINKLCEKLSETSKLELSQLDIKRVFEKTKGHPLAIELIMVWFNCKRNSIDNILRRIVDYDRRDGAELRQKLLEDVATNLETEEKEALYRLCVFRTPIKSFAREYLDISEEIWDSLLQYRWLKLEGSNNFQIHSLIAEFWRKSRPDIDMLPWHGKAAQYYWDLGKMSCVQQLDHLSYLESNYHFRNSNQDVEAALVLNELIGMIHEKERLPSERIPELKKWLFKLDNNILNSQPWLLLEKGLKSGKLGNYKEAEMTILQAYQIFEKEGNIRGICIAKYHLGKTRHLLKKGKLGLEDLEFVLETAKK